MDVAALDTVTPGAAGQQHRAPSAQLARGFGVGATRREHDRGVTAARGVGLPGFPSTEDAEVCQGVEHRGACGGRFRLAGGLGVEQVGQALSDTPDRTLD